MRTAHGIPIEYDESGLLTERSARNVATEWHGGQASALYAFASSGTVLPELRREVKRELRKSVVSYCEVDDFGNLCDLLAWINAYYMNHPEDD